MALVANWEDFSHGIPDVHDIVLKEQSKRDKKTRRDKQWKRVKRGEDTVYCMLLVARVQGMWRFAKVGKINLGRY